MKWPIDILAQVDLPQDTKQFLSEVGLPEVSSLPLRYLIDPNLLDGKFVLGDTYGVKTLLCLESGAVMMEESRLTRWPRKSETLLFLNSSVQQFHDFLCKYEEMASDPKLISEDFEYMKAKTAMLADDMKRIDGRATEPGTAWGNILEDMKWSIG